MGSAYIKGMLHLHIHAVKRSRPISDRIINPSTTLGAALKCAFAPNDLSMRNDVALCSPMKQGVKPSGMLVRRLHQRPPESKERTHQLRPSWPNIVRINIDAPPTTPRFAAAATITHLDPA